MSGAAEQARGTEPAPQYALVAVPVGAVTFWLLSMTDWVLGWQSGVSVLLGALATRLLPNKGLPQDVGKPAATLPAKVPPPADQCSPAPAAVSDWRLYDIWLTALLVPVTIGAVAASLYSRQPLSTLLLLPCRPPESTTLLSSLGNRVVLLMNC